MVQFGQVIKNKNFTIGGIYYGMHECSKENLEGITPIVDLKIFYDLLEWITAIDAFKNYARSDRIEKLLSRDEEISNITKDTFKDYDANIAFANMNALKKFIEKAKESLATLEKSKSPIVRLLSGDIVNFIKKLDHKELSKFQLALAQWYYNNKNYALSFLVLTEAIVTRECEVSNLNVVGKDSRNEAKKSLYERTSRCEVGKTYSTISKIRNSIAHQGGKNIQTHKEIDNLKKYFRIVNKFIKT